jgi:hypothetical protein
MNIVEEVNPLLAVLHKGFSVGAFYGRLLSGGYRVEDSMSFAKVPLPQCAGEKYSSTYSQSHAAYLV